MLKMIVWLFVCLFSVSSYAVLSPEEKEYHLAEKAARDHLKSQGCLWTVTKKVRQFRLSENADKSVRISGTAFDVECSEWSPPVSTTPTPSPSGQTALEWTAPTTRENGMTLYPTEILHYEVWMDGVKLTTTTGTTYNVQGVALGVHSFQIVTVDANNNKSKFSGSYVTEIK